jgi:hypothetical protein
MLTPAPLLGGRASALIRGGAGEEVPLAAGRIHGRARPSPSHDCLCENADILVGAVLLGSHRLEGRESVRRSQLFPLQLEQVWCERFQVFLPPVGDIRSRPTESSCI